jgi:hypothetical protein
VYDVASALAAFTAMRHWNVLLVKSLTPADLARKASHPERGEMVLKTIVETMAGHDINHLKQIEAATAAAGA